MEAGDIFEIGAVAVGVIVLIAGLIDYALFKNRKYGENPKDATWL